MIDLLSSFSPGELIAIVAVTGGLLCGITAIAMGCWLEIRKVALKQEMLQRGMSADEIRAVLDAGSGHSRREIRTRQCC